MNIKDQGHSLTFVQGHSDSTFSNFFSLETARPVEARFHFVPPWDEGMEVNTNAIRTLSRWPLCPYMIKTFKILLLWNQKADDLETWYAALVIVHLKFSEPRNVWYNEVFLLFCEVQGF